MKTKNFRKLHNNRFQFIKLHDTNDHTTILNENSKVLISCPHAVSQVRNGIRKFSEIGAATTVLELNYRTNANFIIKTKNNFDDANFDIESPYKQSVLGIVKKYDIKYFLDFHGLGAHREMDINLGCNFGQNIKPNEKAFDSLVKMLTSNGFSVTVDTPFKAGGNTVSNFVRENTNIFALQIEINCGLTNNSKHSKKFNLLIDIFEDYINYLEKIAKK